MRGKKYIVCNRCGKKVKMEHGIIKEDFCQVIKEWGYFSTKDMKVHKFDLCEGCYDQIVEGFKIPIIIEEKSEAL